MAIELTVIGVGNILMADDGVGPRVIERLIVRPDAAADGRIEYLDGGTGGLRLINWIEQARRLLFVDGADFGGEPGQSLLVTPDQLRGREQAAWSLHETDLAAVLKLTEEYFRCPPTWLLAVQVATVGQSDRLSDTLESRLDALADEVAATARRLLEEPA